MSRPKRRKPLNGGIPFKLAEDAPTVAPKYKRRKPEERRIKEKEAKEKNSGASEGRLVSITTAPLPRKSKTAVRSEADLVEGMALMGATNEEIADFLLCSTDKLNGVYGEVLLKARASMKWSLRRMQWKAAKAGSAAMLIWLGKQYLGQREVAKLEIDWGDLTVDELRELEQGRIPNRLMAKAKLA